jgi:hypothetical protein
MKLDTQWDVHDLDVQLWCNSSCLLHSDCAKIYLQSKNTQEVKMKGFLCTILCLVLSVPAFASHEPKEYQTGKFVSLQSRPVTTGSHTSYSDYGADTTTSQVLVNDMSIAGADGYIYVVRSVEHWRWSHNPQVTENASVQYRIEKRDFYFVDESNKEIKCKIVKRIKPE